MSLLDNIASTFDAQQLWKQPTRWVIGPHVSLDHLKKNFLERYASLFSTSFIATLEKVALEVLKAHQEETPVLLKKAAQVDSLQWLATQPFFKKQFPRWSRFLNQRRNVIQIVEWVKVVDHYFLTSPVDEAQLLPPTPRAFESQEWIQFCQLLQAFWKRGELWPWSEAEFFRKAIAHLNRREKKLPFANLNCFGFSAMTPVEEEFLRTLSEHGLKVQWYLSGNLYDLVDANSFLFPPIERVKINPPQDHCVESWKSHTVYDEIEWILADLQKQKTPGVPWDHFCISLPEQHFSSILLMKTLDQHGIAYQDLSLKKDYRVNVQLTLFVDYLKILSRPFDFTKLREWLNSVTKEDERLALEELYVFLKDQFVFKRWLSFWNSIEKTTHHEQLSPLRWLMRDFRQWAHRFTLEGLHRAIEQLNAPFDEEKALFKKFLLDAKLNRTHLKEQSFNASHWILCFEEYLNDEIQKTSRVAEERGIELIPHGFWPLKRYLKLYVFQAGIFFDKDSRAGDFEEDRIHWKIRWDQDQALNRDLFCFQNNVIYSYSAFDAEGKPQTINIEDKTHEKLKGSNADVPWLVETASLQPRETLPVLRKDLAGHAPRTVSAFEDYLRCPFIFYARHLLKVKPSKEFLFDFYSELKGNLVHKVLERFLRLEIEGRLTLRAQQMETLKRALFNIFDEEFSVQFQKKFQRSFAPKLEEKTKNDFRQALKQWLQWETAQREKTPSLKPILLEEPVDFCISGGFVLRGIVDRVDSDGKYFVVRDYKTGTGPWIGKEIKEGHAAQLLMYALAIQEKTGLEWVASSYLEIGRKVQSKKGLYIDAYAKDWFGIHPRNSGILKEDFNEKSLEWKKYWSEATARLQAGDFTAMPARGIRECENCFYQNRCGYAHEPKELDA